VEIIGLFAAGRAVYGKEAFGLLVLFIVTSLKIMVLLVEP
jgi:hypothetical protein